MTSDRTVDAYVERLPADQQRIVGALRQIIKSAAPSASESIKWAQPVYEAHGPFAYIKAHRAHVTLGFWRGVALDAGRGVLASSGSKMAHMKLRSANDIPATEIRQLVRAAVKLNRELGSPA
jgi:hypothetical protein